MSALPRVSVEVLDETRRLPEPALAWLVTHIDLAIRRLGAAGDVRVRVVDDPAMAQAHEEFAGVPGTTDVLTFDLKDPEESPKAVLDKSCVRLVGDSYPYGLDTDILVCLDEALRHLGGGRYPVEKELLLYVVHGILHCLGMDDHDEAEAAAMHRMEDTILEAIGVGAVFKAGEGEG